MRSVGTSELQAARPASQRPTREPGAAARWVRRQAGDAWLNLLFWSSRNMPALVRGTKPLWLWGVWTFATYVRENTLCNARRLLSPKSTPARREALAKAVIGNFFDFVCDVGQSVGMSRAQLVARITSIEGMCPSCSDDLAGGMASTHPPGLVGSAPGTNSHALGIVVRSADPTRLAAPILTGEQTYRAARQDRTGAIILTAHMGSFEVGIASLLQHEKRIHVLFRRDALDLFETTRSTLRRQLGVIEQCVDDGLAVWVRLREALAADEVVLIQGDRVMPGQKGGRLPFFDGHTLIPTGPIRLALATGAPIIPIFSIRQPDGRIRLFIESPIRVADLAGSDEALGRVRSVMERYVRRFPDQWLMIHRAWCEDNGA